MKTAIAIVLLGLGAPVFAQQLPAPPATFADFAVDPSLDACADFHAYACATWEKAHPIPSDRPSFGTGAVVFDWNQKVLRDILDTTAKGGANRSDTERMIGDDYAACLDTEAIEKHGLEHIKPELERVAALKSKQQLPPLLAHIHRITGNLTPTQGDSGQVTAVFGMGSFSDFANAETIVPAIDQAGLGLPDRDYYFRTDAKSKELREAYVATVKRFFRLAGESESRAAADAKTVMSMETELAKASADIVSRRDPANLNHPMSQQQLQQLTPRFDWKAYGAAMNLPTPDHYLVFAPDFLRAFNTMLGERSLAEWKTYLRWHLLNQSADSLPQAFRDAKFEFFGHRLFGRKAQQPRWKVCANTVDRDLGEVAGRVYVARAFPSASKEKMLRLVHAIEHAFDEEVASLDWMSDATKAQAHQKLAAIVDKIGYPDKWRDYSSLSIDRHSPLTNSYHASDFAVSDDLAHIGKPRDRSRWTMTPPTVNAYYSPSDNTINFPAGILQPPFFDPNASDAENFGGVGAVIGHELTHGFDDQGRKYDANGNLRDWWTAEDASKFEERAKCIRDEYSRFIAVDDVHLNGAQTLGENTADNGGLRIALRALHDVLRAEGKEDEVVNGLTADQRFFLAFGHVWCAQQSPEFSRLLAQSDVHSLSRFRINGTVSNMPEFRTAFGCKAPSAMVTDPACAVW